MSSSLSVSLFQFDPDRDKSDQFPCLKIKYKFHSIISEG